MFLIITHYLHRLQEEIGKLFWYALIKEKEHHSLFFIYDILNMYINPYIKVTGCLSV